LSTDSEKLDGVIDAVEKPLAHFNYSKAVRLPEQAKELYGARTSLDHFWLEVCVQALVIQLPRGVHCGATIVKSQDGVLTQLGATTDALTTLAVIRSLVQNTKIASEESRSLTLFDRQPLVESEDVQPSKAELSEPHRNGKRFRGPMLTFPGVIRLCFRTIQ
jgi:hypothetical protein